MRKIKILVGIFFTLAALNTFSSCVMDMKEAPFRIKNETNDTLLIDLSESDTLADWTSWSELDGIFPNDTDTVDMAFTKAIIDQIQIYMLVQMCIVLKILVIFMLSKGMLPSVIQWKKSVQWVFIKDVL